MTRGERYNAERLAATAARGEQIVAWWRNGETLAEIGVRLGWTPSHAATEIRRLRKKGFDLPHRCQLGEATHAVDSDTGCWNWQGATSIFGYGAVWRGGRTYVAHRWYYEQHVGPIPEGLQLDHLCRNPSCVNPDHLEPVTNAENTRRGRKAKLTLEQAEELRRRRGEGESPTALALEFGIHPSTVSNIVAGRRWNIEEAA